MTIVGNAEKARRSQRERIVDETLDKVNRYLAQISPDLAMAVCRRAWDKSQGRFTANLRQQHRRALFNGEYQDRFGCPAERPRARSTGESTPPAQGDNAAGER